MNFGANGAFHWLSSDCHNLRHLFALSPELFLGRYLAVTSNDSGVPRLTQERQNLGWRFESGMLYSPILASPDFLISIPSQIEGAEGPAFEEYYLFDSPPPDLQPLEVFVNYYITLGIAPAHPKEPDFRKQISRIQPLCYLADGADELIVVSKSQALIASLGQKLAANT